MIAGMKKLTLAAPQSDMERLVRELVWLESVEILPSAGENEELPPGLQSVDNAAQAAANERDLQRLAAASETLAPYGSGKKGKYFPEALTRSEFEALDGDIEKALALTARVEDLIKERAALRAKITKAENDVMSLAPFLLYEAPISLDATRKTVLFKGMFPRALTKETIYSKLDESGLDYALEFYGTNAEFVYVCAAALKSDADAFAKALAEAGFSRILFKDMDGTAKEATDRLKAEIAQSKKALADSEGLLRELAASKNLLDKAQDALSARAARETVRGNLAQTNSTCLLSGWVPDVYRDKVEKVLDGFDCCYTFEEPKEDEKVPVKLINKKLVTPFEAVLGMYSYPDYRGIDPTFIMSIFYFVIFGLIMQDVLYGLMLLVGGRVLLKALHAKPGSSMYKLIEMFSICGISTMVCGVLFGGYFGDLPSAFATHMLGITDFPELAVAFNPVTNPIPYLAISLGLGAVHLITGMLIKAYMLVKDGHALDAVFDIGLWLVLFAGIGLLFLAPAVGKWVAIVGVIGLVLTQGRAEKNIIMKFLKGVLSLYDIVSYLSDLLSYSRIMALGLSGAIIAQVVNLIGTLGGPTVMGFIVLVLAMVLGHTLNLALNLLGAFVHTARLQYIEFFGKFYIDGGEPFKPAAVKTKYTEIIKEAK